MRQCDACQGECICCACKRTPAGVDRNPDCPVPSHQKQLTPVEMGTLIGTAMTRIRAAQLRQRRGNY